MFTKTALNKIKKADLVQMYLDLQAKDYDEKMEQTLEKCCNKAVDEVVNSMKDVIEEVKAENEKLKEEIEELNEECDRRVGGDDHDAVCMENEKLKKENEDLMKKVIVHSLQEESLAEVCVEHKKEIKELKKEIKEYEYESNESGVKEKKLYEQAFAIQAERDRLKEEIDELKKINQN